MKNETHFSDSQNQNHTVGIKYFTNLIKILKYLQYSTLYIL